MSTKKKTTRSTGAQINFLIDYMQSHTSFANGEYSGPMGHRIFLEEWERLRNLLKAHGPDKSIDQWRHTWRDIKKRARVEGARVKKARTQTGNLPVPELNEQSSKVLAIIGQECSMGIDSLEETGIGEMLVCIASAAPTQPTTHSTYAHSPTRNHTITSGSTTTHTSTPVFTTTHTLTASTPSYVSTSGSTTTHTSTPVFTTTHTLTASTPSYVSTSASTTTPHTSTSIATSHRHQPQVPQPTSRAQRRRMLTRASDFLNAEEATRGVLRNISNELSVQNRLLAAEARRHHLEMLRKRRTIFKF